MPVHIVLNGQTKTLATSSPTLLALVVSLGFPPDRIAVEVNGMIIPRVRWPETHLSDGDKVELVQFVGGGGANSSNKSLSQRSP
jgi:thiamine biosynthesis protein ThiS